MEELKTDVTIYLKELDQLVHSVSLLNAARHQVRVQQLDTQHARRIEKLLFESWLSPYTSVQQWFDAQSEDTQDYWTRFYILYRYNPEFNAKLNELDFIQSQIFELLQSKERYEQSQIFSPIDPLLITA